MCNLKNQKTCPSSIWGTVVSATPSQAAPGIAVRNELPHGFRILGTAWSGTHLALGQKQPSMRHENIEEEW